MLVRDDVRHALAREAALPSLAGAAPRPPACSPPRAAPRFELAQVVRDHEAAYAAWCERAQGGVDPLVWKVFSAVLACRTPELGGVLEVCPRCKQASAHLRSCRDRHCPKCPGIRQARWRRMRDERALPVSHVHLVTTQPSALRPLIRANQRALYALLLEATARAIEDAVAARHGLGLRLAMTLVLHTYSPHSRDLGPGFANYIIAKQLSADDGAPPPKGASRDARRASGAPRAFPLDSAPEATPWRRLAALRRRI